MSNQAKRRIIKELQRFEKDPVKGTYAAPSKSSIHYVHAIIDGPIDTDWEFGNETNYFFITCSGKFHLLVVFPPDYPLKPPSLQFISEVCHPNIYPDGRICLDILQQRWSPAYDLSSILTSIQSLLADPNPDSPARTDIAALYQNNYVAYRRKVLECVKDSWIIPKMLQEFVSTFKDD